MNRKAYFQTYLLIRKILQVHIKKKLFKKGPATPLSPAPLLHFPWSAVGSRFLISLAQAATVWPVSSNNTAVEMAWSPG